MVASSSLESYPLEQSEILRSPEYGNKCHAPFKLVPTVSNLDLHNTILDLHTARLGCPILPNQLTNVSTQIQ